MTRLSVIVILIAISGSLWAVDPAVNKGAAQPVPYEVLKKTEYFALGAVGAGASISPEEVSLHDLLKQPDAVEKCQQLLTEATLEGQMYGLLGLKLKDPKAFAAAFPKYSNKTSWAKVRVLSACSVTEAYMVEMANRIAKNTYEPHGG